MVTTVFFMLFLISAIMAVLFFLILIVKKKERLALEDKVKRFDSEISRLNKVNLELKKITEKSILEFEKSSKHYKGALLSLEEENKKLKEEIKKLTGQDENIEELNNNKDGGESDEDIKHER